MKSKEKQFIFTDEIDFTKALDDSIWGTEDQATLDLLAKIPISGKWLNLCAGDGRFNDKILARADKVVAVDIDPDALKKLVRITLARLKTKLKTRVANVVKPLPFTNDSFDGIFCVGTLHLFPRQVFKKIFFEMDRVLKPGGRIIIDFATDIKRKYPDGSLWVVENEPNYTLRGALVFLKNMFKTYQIHVRTSKVAPENVTLNDKTYTFTSNFILIDAVKPKQPAHPPLSGGKLLFGLNSLYRR